LARRKIGHHSGGGAEPSVDRLAVDRAVDDQMGNMNIFRCELALAPPTEPMRVEATGAGFYETMWGKHPRIQILTVAELLGDKRPDMPLIDVGPAFRSAPQEATM
jgi:hypothetical protein